MKAVKVGTLWLGRAVLAAALLAAAVPVVLAQAPVPDDARLEAEGAVIGEIHIDNQDVFDTRLLAEDKPLFRVANRWHVETRPEVVQRYLLFHRGDRYSRRLLDESARLLRELRYLYDATIEPVRYEDGKVDILVTTRDVWSLNPGLSFGRKGGKNTSGFELEELNLLGTGNAVALSHKSGVDRDVTQLGFTARRVLGTWAELEADYESNSDGSGWKLGLDRPFYALDTRWAAGGRSETGNRIDSLYRRGEVAEQFRERFRTSELYAGWSPGLQGNWVRRWTAGLTLDDHAFHRDAALPSGTLPEDRRLVYPWIGFELVEDAYDTRSNHDQMARTEDFFLGTRVRARVGHSMPALGADRSAWIVAASAEHGLLPADGATLLLATRLQARHEDGGVANLRWESGARFYLQQSERRLFFATLEGEYGKYLDRDQQVLLGGDNGLRGYPLRYLGGDRRARFSVEERWFTDWYPFRLFRVGAAAFFDAGRTWGDDGLGPARSGLLKDVGFGLRLGSSRSGMGNIVHIDLAFPLDGDDTISNVQFLIETHHEF
jgi:outer membrane protein assembly factor BamA